MNETCVACTKFNFVSNKRIFRSFIQTHSCKRGKCSAKSYFFTEDLIIIEKMNIYRSKLSMYSSIIEFSLKKIAHICEKCKLMVFQKAAPLDCDNLKNVINVLYP